jgi:Uma2 family endonuclease
LNAPENTVAEILEGELFLSPRPSPRHAVAASRLGALLAGPFDHGLGGPGGWWILDEPELHLGEHVVVPDIAGWRHDRMPRLPDGPFFGLAPDFVCEVISASTARIDRTRKLRIYRESGTLYAWLIDPVQRTLEALRSGDDGWVIAAVLTGRDRVRIAPFEAAEWNLGAL